MLKRSASEESEGGAPASAAFDAGAEDDSVAEGAGREWRTEAPTAINSSAIAKRYGVGREKTLGIRNLSRLDNF